ncbi:MAG: hypothetical protein ACFBZ9_11955, partial [Sphingomonadales bacterium]
GEGAKFIRGSAQGGPVSQSLRGPVMLAAILPPALLPQDASRITPLSLNPLPSRSQSVATSDVEALLAEIQAGAAGLWARAIRRWPRYLEARAVFRAAILEMRSQSDHRMSDQFSALLAGYHVLFRDAPPTPGEIAEHLEAWNPAFLDVQQVQENNYEQQCITHLMTSPAELYRRGDAKTVGQVLEDIGQALREHDASATQTMKALEAIGLRAEAGQRSDTKTNGIVALLVANQHEGLQRIFKNTLWANSRWQRSLKKLPDAKPTKRTYRFGGSMPQRAVELPEAYIPDRHTPES